MFVGEDFKSAPHRHPCKLMADHTELMCNRLAGAVNQSMCIGKRSYGRVNPILGGESGWIRICNFSVRDVEVFVCCERVYHLGRLSTLSYYISCLDANDLYNTGRGRPDSAGGRRKVINHQDVLEVLTLRGDSLRGASVTTDKARIRVRLGGYDLSVTLASGKPNAVFADSASGGVLILIQRFDNHDPLTLTCTILDSEVAQNCTSLSLHNLGKWPEIMVSPREASHMPSQTDVHVGYRDADSQPVDELVETDPCTTTASVLGVPQRRGNPACCYEGTKLVRDPEVESFVIFTLLMLLQTYSSAVPSSGMKPVRSPSTVGHR